MFAEARMEVDVCHITITRPLTLDGVKVPLRESGMDSGEDVLAR